MRFLALSLCALALVPATSIAQQSVVSSQKGPTLQAATAGFRVSTARVDGSTKSTVAPIHRGAGQDVALMVVGVGAMIVGALIENSTAGTIIIIGGAGMALYGLYHYLE